MMRCCCEIDLDGAPAKRERGVLDRVLDLCSLYITDDLSIFVVNKSNYLSISDIQNELVFRAKKDIEKASYLVSFSTTYWIIDSNQIYRSTFTNKFQT